MFGSVTLVAINILIMIEAQGKNNSGDTTNVIKYIVILIKHVIT